MKDSKRTNRTPAERAQADFEVADRLVDRHQAKVDALRMDLAAAESLLRESKIRRDAYKGLRDALGGEPEVVSTVTLDEPDPSES